MGYCGRFSFEGYTPKYPSEEIMLADRLRDISEYAPQTYRNIVSWFLNDNKEDLAKYLSELYAKVKEQRDELKRYAKLKEKLDQLEQENFKMQCKLINVYRSAAGLDLRIRDMYVEGKKSLRQIGDIVGMDKNTVKKHLVKMGVYKG